MSATLEQLVEKCVAEHDVKELALGFLRYETLRRMNPNQFKELHQRNLAGERFDDMVTEELLKWKGGKL
jgi:hypothetical protein